MAKQSPLRYVFKINSTRLRMSKWNLNIKIEEAIRNKELVALAESSAIRFIDQYYNVQSVDIHKNVKNIEKEIKKCRKLPTSRDNRDKIKSLYSQKYQKLLVKDYVCIIVDNINDFNRMNSKKAFFINGVKYKHLIGTTGGIKKYTLVYVSDKLHTYLEDKLNNDRDVSKEFVPAKLDAYRALTCSSSIPVFNTKRILVVKDCETKFTSNVIKIDDTIGDYPVVTNEVDYPITLVDSDGYGLISPELSKMWADELGENYVISGYCVRNSFCKGMVFTFDFKRFAKKIAKSYIVKDIWNTERDIRNIDIVLTASMLKLWDSYESLEHYLECNKKNGYTFSVTKYTPEKLEDERDLNYQFIQSLYLEDSDIDELIQPTVSEINDVLGDDYRKSILFLKGIHLDDMNFDTEEMDFIKALLIDKKMINDPFVKTRIHNMIKKRITEAKIGVLKVKANYSIVSGDPFSLCQSIFKLAVTGLLNKGEFYSKYWNDLNVDKVGCFRAPMTCHNNIRILNLKKSRKLNYWYRHMTTVTIFNSWDTTAHALNGLDKDADAIFTTNNKTILKGIRETDAIFCVQKSAQKCIPTKEDFLNANRNGFGDAIGTITNHITSMFDVLSKFKEGSEEYNTVLQRIMCGQNYQQNAIDKIKGIESKPMPKEWYDYRSNKESKKGLELVADKKPYFFIYIYPHRMKEYKEFINKTNNTCFMRFGLTIQELIDLENKTEEQEKYLKYYYGKMPVSINKSVMNRICWRVEKAFEDVNIKISNSEFDCSLLKSDYIYSKGRYSAIKKLHEEYIKALQIQSKLFKSNRNDKEENKIFRNILKDSFRKQAYEICNNEDELCNIIVDICYKGNDTKQFAWDICGETMIKNLLLKNNHMINYPIADENGDIEFSGNRFLMVTQEVICEDNIE